MTGSACRSWEHHPCSGFTRRRVAKELIRAAVCRPPTTRGVGIPYLLDQCSIADGGSADSSPRLRPARRDDRAAARLSAALLAARICPSSPAWSGHGRELNKLAADHAPDAVYADGTVCFGSAPDHRAYALDLETVGRSGSSSPVEDSKRGRFQNNRAVSAPNARSRKHCWPRSR